MVLTSRTKLGATLVTVGILLGAAQELRKKPAPNSPPPPDAPTTFPTAAEPDADGSVPSIPAPSAPTDENIPAVVQVAISTLKTQHAKQTDSDKAVLNWLEAKRALSEEIKKPSDLEPDDYASLRERKQKAKKERLAICREREARALKLVQTLERGDVIPNNRGDTSRPNIFNLEMLDDEVQAEFVSLSDDGGITVVFRQMAQNVGSTGQHHFLGWDSRGLSAGQRVKLEGIALLIDKDHTVKASVYDKHPAYLTAKAELGAKFKADRKLTEKSFQNRTRAPSKRS